MNQVPIGTSGKAVMSGPDVSRAISRIAHEIVERNHGAHNVVLVGLQRGGKWIADVLAERIAQIEPNLVVPNGSLDVSMHRDDIGLRPIVPGAISEIPFDIVDDIILTDDFSRDHTVSIAKKLGIQHIIEHKDNLGYGANQKSCYQKALELDADIIVMLHPDYQYDPKLIPAMCSLIASGVFKVVLGSRILGKSALKGGMPVYKYLSNRA